jgi:hypothetical protein
MDQAFVHHDPGNLQPEPFRQFFHADGELVKLKARDSNDWTVMAGHQNTATNIPIRLNGWTISGLPSMKYPLYGCIIIPSVQFVLASFNQNMR